MELENQIETLNLLIEFGADEAHEEGPVNRFHSTSDTYKLESFNVNHNRSISLDKMKSKSFDATNKLDELSKRVNSIEELRLILEKCEEFNAPKISKKMNYIICNMMFVIMR